MQAFPPLTTSNTNWHICLSIFFLHNLKLASLEPPEGLEPPTYWLQNSHSSNWVMVAYWLRRWDSNPRFWAYEAHDLTTGLLRNVGWDGRSRTYNTRIKILCVAATLHPNVRGHYALWKGECVMSIMCVYSGTGLKVPVIPSRFWCVFYHYLISL